MESKGPLGENSPEYGDLLGLVVGAWGECSEDLHTLVQVLAQSRVDSVGRAKGRPAEILSSPWLWDR